MFRFTKHAQDRIKTRLVGITDMQEVMRAVESSGISPNSPYEIVEVKRFDKRIEIQESDDRESNSKGDSLVVVVRHGNIITTMLRKLTSRSDRY